MEELKRENYEMLIKISSELMQSGWKIKNIDFDSCTILVSKYFALIKIYANIYENKLSLKDENNPSCYRYYECENRNELTLTIIKLINEFRHENYSLSMINEYGNTNGHDKIETYYFPDEKSLLRKLVDEPVEDENIYSLRERTHQYPNPAIKLFVKRLENDKNFKDKYWQFKNSLIFEIKRIQYKTEINGYSKKVLEEISEEHTYYACITIKE